VLYLLSYGFSDANEVTSSFGAAKIVKKIILAKI
jgi:hypothetical protein